MYVRRLRLGVYHRNKMNARYIHLCVFMYVCVCVYIHLCLGCVTSQQNERPVYICVCTYVCMCVRVYTLVCWTCIIATK